MQATTRHMRQGRPEGADAIRMLTQDDTARWVRVSGREPLPMLARLCDGLRERRFDLLWLGDTLAGLIETVARADHLLIENRRRVPGGSGTRVRPAAAGSSRSARGVGPRRDQALPTSSLPKTSRRLEDGTRRLGLSTA